MKAIVGTAFSPLYRSLSRVVRICPFDFDSLTSHLRVLLVDLPVTSSAIRA
jgi:hypothetical protein